jgi:hypothetical protein
MLAHGVFVRGRRKEFMFVADVECRSENGSRIKR